MNIYRDNIKKYGKAILKLNRSLNKLSTLRIGAFAFSVTLVIILANERLVNLFSFVVPLSILGFGLLITRYKRVSYVKRHTAFFKEINEAEVSRLDNKLSNFSMGQTPINRDHPYISDLDIFGSHSLFQLINRTTTESGSESLSSWLSASASKEVILDRQEAVKELTPKLDWRQDFQAFGMRFKNTKSDYNKMILWVGKPKHLLPYKTICLIVNILLSILSTCSIVYFVVHLIHFILAVHAFSLEYMIPLTITLVVNYLVLRRVRSIAEEIIEDTRHNLKTLDGYESLIIKIESEKFHSELLKQLQSVLSRNNHSAASEIHKLRKILEVFHLRGTKKEALSRGFFYSIFNLIWLFDVYWIIFTEKWKHKNHSYFKSWISAVSDFEALCSLAGFSYSNPTFAFPEIKEESHIIRFDKLGHPLISSESRVHNNFDFKGLGQTAMITGSNMAGKSTFLRTIGANLVLALMGAPCCAKSGQVSHMKIFTSMRTQDNLKEGISSFYAELKRIKQLLKLIESGEAIFFILDEMFKGTNSKDRHKGGFSLIKQLKELNAFGIISTHDLELAILVEKHNLVANYSFNSEIQKGEMIFNYKLTNGVCRDFNASELMKKSGIKILSKIG